MMLESLYRCLNGKTLDMFIRNIELLAIHQLKLPRVKLLIDPSSPPLDANGVYTVNTLSK